MLIHFAFGKYKADTNLQIEFAIEKIFSKRELLFGKNPEFIPRIKPQYHPAFIGAKIKPIPLQIAKKGPNYIGIDVMNNGNISENHFSYIREDIRMICFTDISMNNIDNSIHVGQYGKLGIIFHKEFLENSGIRKVYYYEEDRLINDDKVREWNFYAYRTDLNTEEKLKKRELEIEILSYRKPIKMFKSFKELRRLNLAKGCVEDVYDVYNNFEIGYDFQKEKEWRLVSFQNDYLNFSESDLSLVLVPNDKIRVELTQYFKSNWSNLPVVKICN